MLLFWRDRTHVPAPTQLMHSPKLLVPIFRNFFWPFGGWPLRDATLVSHPFGQLMKGAGLTYHIHAIELTDLLAQFSMDQRRAHLDPAYRSALLTCAVLNIAMAFIEGIVGLWITG